MPTAEEFIKSQLGETESTNVPFTNSVLDYSGVVLPLSKKAVENQFKKHTQDYEAGQLKSGVNQFLNPDESFVKSETRSGIPLDVSEGITASQRVVMSFLNSDEDKLGYLQSKYGSDKVRQSKDSKDFIIEVKDPQTGLSKEILANERGMSFGDVAGLSQFIPEMAGAIYGMKGARKIPKIGKIVGKLGTARDVVAGSTGSELAGGAVDVVTTSQPNITEIAKERALNVPLNVAMDYGTLGAARLARGAVNLAANPLGWAKTDIQKEAIAARKRIKEKTGTDLPLSSGEVTGHPALQMMESYIEASPAGAAAQLQFKNLQDQRVRAFQDFLFDPSIPMGKTGNEAVDLLQQYRTAAAEGVSKETRDLGEKVTRSISNELGLSTGSQARIYKEDVGGLLRTRIHELRDVAKADSDRLYGLAKEASGGTGKVFPGEGLAARAAEIKNSLPSPEKMSTELSTILDQYGNPISQEEIKTAVLKEFVPPNILSRLNELISNKNAMYSLDDLRQMRREVYDDIAKSEAVPGYGTHYLNKIGKSLTDAIDTGIDRLPNSDLKNRLQIANQHYKTEVIKFEQAGIGDIFPRVTERGFMENTQIIDRLARDPGKYKRTMDIIGPQSQEAEILRMTVRDDVFQRSLSDSTGETINAVDFIRNLKNLSDNHREIYDDVFGQKTRQLLGFAQFGKFADGKINLKELRDNFPQLLQGNPGYLDKLIKARAAEETLYKNNIINKFTKGELDSKVIDPNEFVNKFIGGNNSTDDIKEVMTYLSGNPDLTNRIRKKVIESVFIGAERSPTALDLTRKGTGDPTVMVSGKSLAKSLGDASDKEKLRAVLGNDSFSLLEDYIKWEAARDRKKEIAAGTGFMAKGTAIGRLINNVPGISELSGFVKYKILSNMLAHPTTRAWLSNDWTMPQLTQMAPYIIASQPVMEGIIEDFGRDSRVYRVLNQIKQKLNTHSLQPESEPTRQSADVFLEEQLAK